MSKCFLSVDCVRFGAGNRCFVERPKRTAYNYEKPTELSTAERLKVSGHIFPDGLCLKMLRRAGRTPCAVGLERLLALERPPHTAGDSQRNQAHHCQTQVVAISSVYVVRVFSCVSCALGSFVTSKRAWRCVSLTTNLR